VARGIRVGDGADSVRARYGPPDQVEGEYWIYPARDYPKLILGSPFETVGLRRFVPAL
jgi:hypothetical protein